jgi:myo-inositol 2-dehydrogenase/D-chiro-inositol 1-dehydrogenase
MKFAFLNADADSLPFAAALIAAGDEPILIDASPQAASLVIAADLDARRCAEWEEALACGADYVLVGGGGSEVVRLEQLQRLAQESVAAMFVHPQSSSTLAYLELDMHRQATNTALVPLEATRHREEIARLAQLGRCDEVIVEHRSRVTSRDEVLRRFVRDIGAIRRLTGPCEKVSAMGSLGAEGATGQIGVQISTTSGALIRWTFGPTRDVVAVTWRVLCNDATAEIAIDAVGKRRLQITRSGQAEPAAEYSQADAEQAAAAAARAAVADSNNDLWREALADLELVEAVERSLRRGRTVELFHEEASEEGTFHGVMAAGGCLILMLGIGLAIVATMVGRFKFAIADIWPKALLAVMGLFLLLQLLKFAFPPRDSNDR